MVTECLARPEVLSDDPILPSWEDLDGQVAIKYVSPKYALEVSNQAVRPLIEQMVGLLANEPHRYRVVDVRYWPVLQPGEVPALPGWHKDCDQFSTSGTAPETHILVVAGAGSLTAFLDRPIANWEPRGDYPMWRAPEGRFVRFKRDHLHRAMPATYSGPRFLCRVTATDLIRPQRHITTVTTVKVA